MAAIIAATLSDKDRKKAVCSRKPNIQKKTVLEPLQLKGSQLDDQVDKEILEKLKSILDPLVYLNRTQQKHTRYKGSHTINKDSEKLEELPIDQELEKRKQICSALCFGFRSVVRALEEDKLRLLLISQKTQPSDLKRVLLTLVATRDCPCICLSDILPYVQHRFNWISSITAMGFYNNNDHGKVFDDFVKFASKFAQQLCLPYDAEESPMKGDILCSSLIESPMKGDNLCSSLTEITSRPSDEMRLEKNIPKLQNKKIEGEEYQKYYIPAKKSEISSSFANQEFISFSSDGSEPSILFIGGKVQEEGRADPNDSLSIASFCKKTVKVPANSVTENKAVAKKSEKRKYNSTDNDCGIPAYKSAKLNQIGMNVTKIRKNKCLK